MKKTLVVVLAVLLLAAVPVTVNAYTIPPEIESAGAIDNGVWPLAAGMYDPSLDGKGIKDGTYIYGFYELDMATFAVTAFETVPDAIAGYVKVDSPEDMTDGTFCILTVSPSTTYSYVLVLGEPGAAAATEEPAPAAESEEPALVEEQEYEVETTIAAEPEPEPEPAVEIAPIAEAEPVAEPAVEEAPPVVEAEPVVEAAPISAPVAAPKTADNSGLYTLVFVMLGAAAVLALVLVIGKKRVKN